MSYHLLDMGFINLHFGIYEFHGKNCHVHLCPVGSQCEFRWQFQGKNFPPDLPGLLEGEALPHGDWRRVMVVVFQIFLFFVKIGLSLWSSFMIRNHGRSKRSHFLHFLQV